MVLSVFYFTFCRFYIVTASYQSETMQLNPEQQKKVYEFREEHGEYFWAHHFCCRCNRHFVIYRDRNAKHRFSHFVAIRV